MVGQAIIMGMRGQFGSTRMAAAHGGVVEKWGCNGPPASVTARSFLSALLGLQIDASKLLVLEELPPVGAKGA